MIDATKSVVALKLSFLYDHSVVQCQHYCNTVIVIVFCFCPGTALREVVQEREIIKLDTAISCHQATHCIKYLRTCLLTWVIVTLILVTCNVSLDYAAFTSYHSDSITRNWVEKKHLISEITGISDNNNHLVCLKRQLAKYTPSLAVTSTITYNPILTLNTIDSANLKEAIHCLYLFLLVNKSWLWAYTLFVSTALFYSHTDTYIHTVNDSTVSIFCANPQGQFKVVRFLVQRHLSGVWWRVNGVVHSFCAPTSFPAV